MPAYAIGHLTDVRFGPDIVRYLEGMDATLAPFGGRFVSHGERPEVKEGHWGGDLIMIAFPDLHAARAWYDSPAYQAILPYRTRSADGSVFLIDGTPAGHRATDILAPGLADAP